MSLDWTKINWNAPRPAPSPAKATRNKTPIRARYDNSQTTDENFRSWSNADYFSAKSANSFQVRRELRRRSRYEVANNPYLFGICNSNADDLIDTGPTLQVTSPDASYNRAIETAWREWASEVDLVEKLRTLKLAKSVDGEGFLVLKTAPNLENPVKLYPCDLEADQVTTPAPANLADLWVDGLTLDKVTGRPTAYHVLRHHPGDMFFPDFNPLRVDVIPSRHVIHWFGKFRPGQVRGVPVFTSALDLFSELRAFRKAVLQKAQLAANLTAVLETEGPPDPDDEDTPEPFDHVPIDKGTMTTLPAGNTLKPFESAEPATTYEMFQEKCLGEACRPMSYPLNRALGTSQKFNFSSAKLDHIDYRNSLRVERGDADKVAMERIFRAWFEEGRLIPGYLPPGATLSRTPREWHWPGFATLDATADTQADISQINAGTLTWREFWASRGYDWREVMKQQQAEKKEIDRLGLTFGEPGPKPGPDDSPPAKPKPSADGDDGGIAAEVKKCLRVLGYDPDQPRADDGKWGDGGGGGNNKSDVADRSKEIPSNDELDKVKLSTEKSFPLPVATIGEKKFAVKLQGEHDGKTESLVSNLAQVAGVKVPAVAVREIRGLKVVVSEKVEGRTPYEVRISHAPGGTPHEDNPKGDKALKDALAKVPKEEIDRHALFDYTVGYNDGHARNYLLTPDRHLVGIDKELSLNGTGGKGTSTSYEPAYHLDFAPGANGDRANVKLARAEVTRAAEAADKIAAHLESIGRGGAAKGVLARGQVLRGLLSSKRGDPTIGDLVAAGKAADKRK
jgi:capsid protein